MTIDSSRLRIKGPIQVETAAGVVQSGSNAIASGVYQIDLAEVTEVDSSGLAVVLHWMREAKQRDHNLVVLNLPPGMRSLASVYGLAEILPQ